MAASERHTPAAGAEGALAAPAPGRPTHVEPGEPWSAVRETHSGVVVLLGESAYKVKKPVDLGFLDFTSPSARLTACRREVELNRRLAPDVYRGVGTLEDPDLGLEPVVAMRRMPESRRLSTLVRGGANVDDDLRRLARLMATFHAAAERGPHIDHEGTRDAIEARWSASFDQARPYAGAVFEPRVLGEIERLTRRFLAGREALFEDRIRRRRVVDGHGDLTADDVFCLPDGPRPLDCLEFADTLRYVDGLDDIAFLAMELEHLRKPRLARILLTEYVEFAGDPAPPALVHHFLAYRAFVRAKVSVLAGAQTEGPAARQAREYARITLDHLARGAVSLVLVGGPPGTGKSTLAGDLADRLGLVVLNSDRVRKELAGLDPTAPAPAAYGEGIYDDAHSRRTYAELRRRARTLLGLGESVVLDASWSVAAERAETSRLAEECVADLVALRCELDADVAAGRMRGRTGVSDADVAIADVVRRVEEAWPEATTINTRHSREACVDAACAVVRSRVSVPPPRTASD